MLASASPRRQELLRTLISDFDVFPAQIDEESHTLVDPVATARLLAKLKAEEAQIHFPNAVIIAGDTVVAVETETGWTQLSKPKDRAEARSFLLELSGRSHVVITALAIAHKANMLVDHEKTIVRFRALAAAEIETYIATSEPYDKAGGYGIQGAASHFIEGIDGSTSNVIGLPVEKLEAMLSSLPL